MRNLLIVVIALLPCWAVAQKKELGQARAYIKSGKDFDKAEKLMTDLLKDPANRQNPRIYQILMERFVLKAEESVFIDDAQRNVDGARAVGMEALLFEGAGKLRADLSRLLQEPLQ